MVDESLEFKPVYSNVLWRDNFYTFLQNIYNVYPEDKLHYLIKTCCEKHEKDHDIYHSVQQQLLTIKPFLFELRYEVPALIKQKKELARQTISLLEQKTINGYVEIGTIGRYVSELRKHITIKEPIYVVNDAAPGFSPVDMVERGQIRQLGQFVPLNNYEPIAPENIPDASVDMVTCYSGLHHILPEKLEAFFCSILRILRPGGSFVVREHDASTPQMCAFVNLVHTVSNAGLGISWEENRKELRYFTSVEELAGKLKRLGFQDTGKRLLQEHDPSLNTLMEFKKI